MQTLTCCCDLAILQCFGQRPKMTVISALATSCSCKLGRQHLNRRLLTRDGAASSSARSTHLLEAPSIMRTVRKLQQAVPVAQAMLNLPSIMSAIGILCHSRAVQQTSVEGAKEGGMPQANGHAISMWCIVAPLHG